MPSITRPCQYPSCGALITSGRYCALHLNAQPSASAIYEATKRKDDPALAEAARIRKTARWQNFRKWFIARHPLCADPFKEHGDMPVPVRQVHHVVSVVERPDLLCDELNCRSLCTGCHGKVESMERQGKPTAALFAAADAR